MALAALAVDAIAHRSARLRGPAWAADGVDVRLHGRLVVSVVLEERGVDSRGDGLRDISTLLGDQLRDDRDRGQVRHDRLAAGGRPRDADALTAGRALRARGRIVM